jgi:hypothetical protein
MYNFFIFASVLSLIICFFNFEIGLKIYNNLYSILNNLDLVYSNSLNFLYIIKIFIYSFFNLENVVSLILSTSKNTAMHSLAFMTSINIKFKIKNNQLENTKIINRKYSKNSKFDSKKITLTELIFKLIKTILNFFKSIYRLIIKNYLVLFSIISYGTIFIIMARNGLILFNKIKLIFFAIKYCIDFYFEFTLICVIILIIVSLFNYYLKFIPKLLIKLKTPKIQNFINKIINLWSKLLKNFNKVKSFFSLKTNNKLKLCFKIIKNLNFFIFFPFWTNIYSSYFSYLFDIFFTKDY